MAILLYCVGIAAVLAGGATIGFGIPVSEFSFGNTLIAAGTTALVGGLIVIGLGAVVTKLQQIVDGQAEQGLVRPDRALDRYPVPSGAPAPEAGPGRIPFPPKSAAREPQPSAPRMPEPASAVGEPSESEAAQSFAPTLRNPDVPPVTVEEEVSLSPQEPAGAPPPFPPRTTERPQSRDHGSFFDTMWPPETRTPQAARPADTEPRVDVPASGEGQGHFLEPGMPSGDELGKAAVLKSGVVDGMAYTLYVDGSIEAQLPLGTLRFASIDELRNYLEKNA